jgi:endonuclease/exonuclease/phosphatase family metal-dependent hydrolase
VLAIKSIKMRILIFAYVLLILTACGVSKNQNRGKNRVPGRVLKIMSYNIHIGNPPSKPGIIDMKALINAIKIENPDLVALQEVDVNTMRSGKINQAENIAKSLRMNFYFAKAIDHDGGDYGVCILSKYPISDVKTYHLTTIKDTGGEPRVLATAKIHLKNGKFIRFGATHLDHLNNSVNREVQMEEINRIALNETLPFIIAGDLNAVEESSAIQKMDKVFTRTCQKCDPTFPVVKPNRTIDFIAYRIGNPFSILEHKVIQEHYASDHLPVIAMLRYNW